MNSTIHDYIRITRIELKLSIQQLAKMSGVSASHISRIERSNRKPSAETLEKLAPHLQVDYFSLLKMANLFDKKEHQIVHLETVLEKSYVLFDGKTVDEQTKKEILQLLNQKKDSFE